MGKLIEQKNITKLSYSKMPFLFLTLDNTAGIAITSDNNIFSIFYSRDGKPDIVFWVHNGDSTEDVILNFGNYIVDWEHVHTFKTYDEAEGYRDRIIKDNE